MSARAMIDTARALRGVRWRHRGRKPWALDCVGLIVVALRGAGVEVADAKNYGREPWDGRLIDELRSRFGEPIDADDAMPGDIALIRWRKGEPSHVGIVADHPDGGLSLIHSSNVHGVVEVAMTGPYRACVVEVYRPWHDKFSR